MVSTRSYGSYFLVNSMLNCDIYRQWNKKLRSRVVAFGVARRSIQIIRYNFLCLFQTGKTETCSKKINLAIILDPSASIDEDNFNLAKGFANRLLESFTISRDNSRVTILSYSQGINIQLRFSDDQDERKLEGILRNTIYEGSSTSTGKAIKFVNLKCFRPNLGRELETLVSNLFKNSSKKTVYEDKVGNRTYIHKQLGNWTGITEV